MEADPWGALVAGPGLLAPGAPGGPLAGMSVVVKDLFDLAGVPTGAGSPEWRATHEPPARHAEAVARLLAAGADVVGKASTDELAYSLSGTNPHYGTPRNPAAPGRVPGGSSSGSAVAVAAGLCDLALGTDTGGSVRVPASHCGVVGLRPTHGRVPTAGLVPLAPGFDTVGWFARDVETVRRAAAVLLDPPAGAPPGAGALTELVVADDAFDGLDPAVAEAMARAVDAAGGACAAHRHAELAPVGAEAHAAGLPPGGLDAWVAAFRAVQGAEAWAAHGEWIARVRPQLGRGVAERFAYAATVTPGEAEEAAALKPAVRRRLAELLGDAGALCLPATPGPAPLLDATPDQHASWRLRTLRLTCAAGLAGAPCLVLPAGRVDGAPVGLALVARPGADEALLALGAAAEARLGAA